MQTLSMVVAEKLINQILDDGKSEFDFTQRCNVVALILINLPRSYRKYFDQMIVETIGGDGNKLKLFSGTKKSHITILCQNQNFFLKIYFAKKI